MVPGDEHIVEDMVIEEIKRFGKAVLTNGELSPDELITLAAFHK